MTLARANRWLDLIATLVFFSSATPLSAENQHRGSVSVFQAPVGFVEELEDLSSGTINFSHLETVWRDFYEADYWVFFMSGERNIKQLPGVIEYVLEVAGVSELGQVSFVRGLVDETREVGIIVFNVEEFEHQESEYLSCRAANAVYSFISDETRSEMNERLNGCGFDK